MKKEKEEPQDKTVGTIGAAKARAKANALTNVERADLLKRGLRIIYGGGGHAKTNAGRG